MKTTPVSLSEDTTNSSDFALSDRKTDELVIALVGPIGAGVSKTAALLESAFRDKYKYQVSYIRVSDLITEFAELVGETISPSLTRDQHKAKLQEIGSKFRKRFSEDYLAEKCVERIAINRLKNGYTKQRNHLVPESRRHVHIIDSLKNPAEVDLLRDVYGDTFWLFGIFAPEEIRRERLLNLGLDEAQLQKIMSVDEEEGVEHGQRVRETIHKSDFFIRNDSENDSRLERVIHRYLEILFNIAVHTPTQDESAMYTAAAAAAASACLSRQVGAAIYSSSGELIGIGANDVPKKGGSLYSTEDGDHDHRCYKWGGKICHNDDRKHQLYQEIFEVLSSRRLMREGISFHAAVEALRQTDVRNLIEYARAVHAEMEAIISVARGHKHGLVGSTMYTTTFPCHSCARHIVASGIGRVVYIEPYAKSLALALHRDAISVREDREGTHVLFLQYEGVAPKNVMRLFKHGLERKDQGKLSERDPKKASPVFPSPLDGFSVREQIVVNRLCKIEQEAESKTQEVVDGGEKAEPTTELPLVVQPVA